MADERMTTDPKKLVARLRARAGQQAVRLGGMGYYSQADAIFDRAAADYIERTASPADGPEFETTALATFVSGFREFDPDDMLIYRRAGDGGAISLGDLRAAVTFAASETKRADEEAAARRTAEAERDRAQTACEQIGIRLNEAEAREATLRAALRRIINAKALRGVRELVAGWNGENRPDGPYAERHPARLGATLPKTTCGAVYELDEAMQSARTALATTSTGEGS